MAELAAADKIAAHYAEWAVSHPPADVSRVSLTTLRRHALAYCEAILTEQIAASHHLSVENIDRERLTAAAHTSTR